MMCGKRVYFRRMDALIVAHRQVDIGVAEKLRAYKCQKCRFWHLTKSKGKKNVVAKPNNPNGGAE